MPGCGASMPEAPACRQAFFEVAFKTGRKGKQP